MNKIVTINIGGIAIAIEEDAYDMLRDYLKNIGSHFANTENGDEIVSDIELRIAEVLQAKLTAGKVSINREDVREVAEAMGYPSDFEEEEESKKKEESDEPENKREKQEQPREKVRRRLFRDVDEQRVGGVCAGLANYFGLDVTLLRILWVVSVFVFGTGILLYVILWAVLPEARTTAEKLEMKGEAPNIENIKKTIHEEASAAYSRITSPESRKTVSHFFERMIHMFGKLFGGFFKMFALAVFVGIIILLITMFVGFLFNNTNYNWDSGIRIDEQTMELVFSGHGSLVFKIALYLVCAIPLIYLAMKVLPEILSVPKPTKPVKQGVLSAWFLSIIVAVMGFFYSVYQFNEESSIRTSKELIINSDTVVIKIDDLLADKYGKGGKRIDLNVVQETDDHYQIDIRKSARGKSKDAAKESLNYILDGYSLAGNVLLISERVMVDGDDDIIAPNLDLTLRLPVGKTVIFHESTKRVISDIKNLQNIYDPEMAGHAFLMTYAGLKCIDCGTTAASNDMNRHRFGNETFDKIEIEGALKVEIIEGEPIRIDIPTDEGFGEMVEARIRNGKLKLEHKTGAHFRFKGDNLIHVYVPSLRALKLEGACNATFTASGVSVEYFEVEVEGTSKLKATNLMAKKMVVSAESASRADLSGTCELLLMETTGVAEIDAKELVSTHANVDLHGGSKVGLHVVNEIKGDIKGVSELRYYGSPEVRIDRTGGSKVVRLD